MTNGKLQQWKSVFLSVILLFGLAPIDAREPAPSFDIVITNGRIIDGTGSPWYSGDIGIRAGRIAAIGSLSAASRSRTIDAPGKSLRPVSSTCSDSPSTPSASTPACPPKSTQEF